MFFQVTDLGKRKGDWQICVNYVQNSAQIMQNKKCGVNDDLQNDLPDVNPVMFHYGISFNATHTSLIMEFE